jgi:hypothetical protein
MCQHHWGFGNGLENGKDQEILDASDIAWLPSR